MTARGTQSSLGSMRPVLPLLLVLATLFAGVGRSADAPAPNPGTVPQPRTLNVVADDNYPPFLFRDVDGDIQGYLVDYWDLWSRRTGVKVTLEAKGWADAQREFLAGRGDVIDMLYRTEAARAVLRFLPTLLGPAGRHLSPRGHQRHQQCSDAQGFPDRRHGRRRLHRCPDGPGHQEPGAVPELHTADRGRHPSGRGSLLSGRGARAFLLRPAWRPADLSQGIHALHRAVPPCRAQGRSGNAGARRAWHECNQRGRRRPAACEVVRRATAILCVRPFGRNRRARNRADRVAPAGVERFAQAESPQQHG